MSDIEREEFEQAVADKWSDSYKFTRFGDEDYYDEVLEGMWQGWQASREAVESEAVAWLWVVNGHRATVPKDYADELIEDGETVLPLYTNPARDGQALEGEPTAIVNDSGVLEWYPPYNRPPAGTKLYTHPASAAKQAVSVPVYAIGRGGYIQHDTNTGQLEIYETEALARVNARDGDIVRAVNVNQV